MVRWLIFNALLVSSVAYGLIKGEATERTVAAVFIAGIVLTQIVIAPFSVRYANLQFALMAVDISVFLGLVGVSLWSTKFWPMWVAAMQGVTVLSHLSILFGPEVGSTVYGHAVQLWSYPMLLTLLIATHRLAKKRRT